MLKRLLGRRARLGASLADRLDLVLENLVLRQQLAMYERRDRAAGRSFRGSDRLFWCLLARFWPRWREPLRVVQPETVLRWRRRPWLRHLLGKPCGRPGRPRVDPEIQMLIRRMAAENWLWGSRRVLGELKALGIEVSNSTVRRYKAEVPKPAPGQRWSTLFYNHGPYLPDALREAVDDRARRVLEVLQQLVGSRLGRLARVSAEQWLEVPGDVREFIDERHGSLFNRRPDYESLSDRARDGPDRYADAA
jgi:hypothetical protein